MVQVTEVGHQSPGDGNARIRDSACMQRCWTGLTAGCSGDKDALSKVSRYPYHTDFTPRDGARQDAPPHVQSAALAGTGQVGQAVLAYRPDAHHLRSNN